MRYLHPKDLLFAAPTGLAVGAFLAFIQEGAFWLGWAGFTVLLLASFLALIAAVRWAHGGSVLAWMAALALGLRLLTGTTLFLALPIDGYDEPDDRAGHVFTDAHQRDDRAWELASSRGSLASAFDSRRYGDQYGGLLALSALAYRLLSPGAHRPLLVLALASTVGALGVPFYFSAARRLWDMRVARVSSWIYCLYPESILTGGAQMREPFLLTSIAIALCGFAAWHDGRPRSSWVAMVIGFGALILISPGIALALLALLAVWLWVDGAARRAAFPLWLGGAALFIVGLLFLAWSLSPKGQGAGTPIGTVVAWFGDSVTWVVYQLERGSGQVQNVFSKLFPAAQFAFVVAYGVTQPLLPPAFLEPTTLTWHAIGIFRSLGWYALLPLLAYAPFAARRHREGDDGRVWRWLILFGWAWIVFCSIRGGGDQWDNPRYRVIFLGVHALVAARAWLWWMEDRDPWLPRVLAAEILCLALWTQWYLARYYLIGIHFPSMVVMGMSIVVVAAILIGGALWDRWRAAGSHSSTA